MGRELSRVIPNARYIPRGVKTVEKLASMAGSLGQRWVMVINSSAGRPKELRFLSVGEGWRWLDKKVELGDVKLQRDLGRLVRFEEMKIYAEEGSARELAAFLGEVFGVPVVERLPETGGTMLITTNSGLKIQFQRRPGPEFTGPLLQVIGFG